MAEEPKMERYTDIIVAVQAIRIQEQEIEKLHDQITDIETKNTVFHKKLKECGITCHNVANCVDVGIKCYKCNNNSSRRSYFRDLLERGKDVGMYAMSASMFNAVE